MINVLYSKGNNVELIKELGNVKEGIAMIEDMLDGYKDDLPDGKSPSDFGGGYVEVLKTKANAVFYFGFDSAKNRVSMKVEIERDEVLLWLEAMAETVWKKQSKRVKFGSKTRTNEEVVVTNNGIKRPDIGLDN